MGERLQGLAWSLPRWRPCIMAVGILAALAAPVDAQPEPGVDLCLLSLDELASATGLAFDRTRASAKACTYESDPSVDLYAVDLRLVDGADLDAAQSDIPRGGQHVSVAGLPAWSSDDGLMVDIGEHLLLVRPVFFLSDATPDPVEAQASIAELVVPRALAMVDVRPDAPRTDDLASLFPGEVAGQQLLPEVMGGEVLRLMDLGTAGMEAALAESDMTLEDVTVAAASTSDGTEIIAIATPGADASLLVPAILERIAGPSAMAVQQERGGKPVIEAGTVEGQGIWIHVGGDILWLLVLPPDGGLDAILEALP